MHDELSKLRKGLAIDPLFSVSETDPEIAKQRLREACLNCETKKAMAAIKAKMIVADRKGGE